MKRRILVAAIAIITALSMTAMYGCSSGGGGETSSVAGDDISKLIENTDADFAKEVSETLAYDEDLMGKNTGFRLAGSDAEHAAADYLEKTFKDIGLEDVEKVPVEVDKWQFDDAYLKISYTNKDGDKKNFDIVNKRDKDAEIDYSDRIISYAAEGTVQKEAKGDTTDWSKMDIVDVGEGHEADYAEVDVKGKIVLVSVDQWNDSWIDTPYNEAYEQGAAAIVSYQRKTNEENGNMGYGQLGNDGELDGWTTVNVQDICARGDLIPCVSISPKDAQEIQSILKDGKDINADLMVDNELGDDKGTTYNIVGKIAGSGNTGQQILYSGHYDKYFYGLNDDCTAVGLIAGIAKSMIDAEYKPVNDIYFVAHGAEEWGQADSQDDWAIGSWQMITKAKPEWQGTTLASLNFEMPAIKSGVKQGQIQTSAELDGTVTEFLESDLLGDLDSYYSDGVITEKVEDTELSNEPSGMSDSICYQSMGVPALINQPDFEEPVEDPTKSTTSNWMVDRYHTKYDNSTSYSDELMAYDIGLYGGLGEYIDQKPALELDIEQRCATLEAAADGTADVLPEDSKLADDYTAAIEGLKEAGKTLDEKAKDINDRYATAVDEEASDDELDKIRAEGTELNKTSLEIFADIQNACMGLVGSDVYVRHVIAQENIATLDRIIGDLKKGEIAEESEEDPGTIGAIASLYGYAEAQSFSYGDETLKDLFDTMNLKHNKDTWGYGRDGKRNIQIPDTWKTSKELFTQVVVNEDVSDLDKYVEPYQKARDNIAEQMETYLQEEIDGINDVSKKINEL